MSLAPTNNLGARLKARLAVNGIHSSSSDGSAPVDAADGALSVSVAMIRMVRGRASDDRNALPRRDRYVEYVDRSPNRGGHADERKRWRSRGSPTAARGDSAPQTRTRSVARRQTHGRVGNRRDRARLAKRSQEWEAAPSQTPQEAPVGKKPASWHAIRDGEVAVHSSEEAMADVQIQQPSGGSGSGSGGSGAAWAIVVLVLLAIIAWFVFGGGLHRTSRTRVDINVPNAGAPASGSAPSGSAPPGGGAAPSSPAPAPSNPAPKTP